MQIKRYVGKDNIKYSQMSLSRVEEAIKNCERMRVEKPDHYEKYVKEQHELLVKIKGELERRKNDPM